MEAVSVSLKDRNRFVVAFTGFNGKLMMPVDRFMTRADMADYSQVIVNDPSRGLSMCGHDGRFTDFHGFISFLRTTIGDPERLVVTGTSAGSFGALLCGHLLEADVVTAFSPFVCIDPERLVELGDTRTFAESFHTSGHSCVRRGENSLFGVWSRGSVGGLLPLHAPRHLGGLGGRFGRWGRRDRLRRLAGARLCRLCFRCGGLPEAAAGALR